jgi:signal transduction histidine kinase
LAKVPNPVFKTLEIKPWVHGIGLLFQPEFQSGDIHFSTSLDKDITSILTDEKLLNQVIINLMTNAIDAVSLNSIEEQKKISISIWRTQLNTVQIEVSDNGCGIEESLMDKIFVPFFTTKEGGNGIGLSLSRQIVRKLRGKLTFRSQSGHGSKFIVEL